VTYGGTIKAERKIEDYREVLGEAKSKDKKPDAGVEYSKSEMVDECPKTSERGEGETEYSTVWTGNR